LWIVGANRFGQRRAYGLLPRDAAGEVHVRIDGEAHAGQHVAQVGEFVERQADGQRELTPGLDAAGRSPWPS
jgi:hypothetical protein